MQYFDRISLKRICLVDVAGLEPAAPCLQSRLGKTLSCFVGAAYNENHRNSRSSNVPKLYRSIRIRGLTTRTRGPFRLTAKECKILNALFGVAYPERY